MNKFLPLSVKIPHVHMFTSSCSRALSPSPTNRLQRCLAGGLESVPDSSDERSEVVVLVDLLDEPGHVDGGLDLRKLNGANATSEANAERSESQRREW